MTAVRELNFGDVFRMAKIIGKADLKQNIIDFFITGKSKKAVIAAEVQDETERKERLNRERESMGVDFFFALIEKAPNSEKEIYNFLGGLAGMKGEEIEKSPIKEIAELIGDIIRKNEDIADFFISVLRSPTLELSTKS